jgi:hypothetical protein
VEPQNWQKYQKKFDFGGRNSVLWRMEIILKANVVCLYLLLLLLFWYDSPNFLDKHRRFTEFCDRLLKGPCLTVSRSFDERSQHCVVKDKEHFIGQYR